ncbi:phage tail protein I [Photobacterium sp. SP02]|uniref:phage tail protein I n=1 Tax=Photobacterium sp. SP02 TaxID=3032280 RepID=UPI0031450AD3
MSEPNSFTSVQPENRTDVEEALEYAWHRVIQSQSSPYPDLKQPNLTREEFVSLLAAERGVMDWQPIDTLAQQRKTAEKAFDIHRKAGTREGLAVAMDALDCDIEITPWYRMEQPPGPYHLELTAWKRNAPVTKAIAERMLTRIERTKSERDTVGLILGFGVASGFGFSGVMQKGMTTQDVSYSGEISSSPVAEANLSITAVPYHWTVNDDAFSTQLAATPGCHATVYSAGAMRFFVLTEIDFGVSR